MRLTTIWIMAVTVNVASLALNSVSAIVSVVMDHVLWLIVALVCIAVNATCLSRLFITRPEEYR
jgi:hypothetical protein